MWAAHRSPVKTCNIETMARSFSQPVFRIRISLNVDPDPDPGFILMRIWIRILIRIPDAGP